MTGDGGCGDDNNGEDDPAATVHQTLPQRSHLPLYPDSQLATFLANGPHPTPGTFGWDLGPGTGSDVGSLLDPHGMALLAGVGLGGVGLGGMPFGGLPVLDWPPQPQRPGSRGKGRKREASSESGGEDCGTLAGEGAAVVGLSSLDVLVAAAISSDEPCQDAALNLLAAAAAIEEEQTGGPDAADRMGLESDVAAHVFLGNMVGSHLGSIEPRLLAPGCSEGSGGGGSEDQSGASDESDADGAPAGAANHPALLLGAAMELPWFMLPSSLEPFNGDVQAGPPDREGASTGRKRAASADAVRHDSKAPRVTKEALKEVT